MSRRQAYLCAKVRPGEIERGDILEKVAKTRILAEAADIVRLAVARGLMSYPVLQKFREDGRPDPMFVTLRHKVGQNTTASAHRAYLLSENGSTHRQIADRCKVAIAKVPGMIATGKAIHKAKVASEPGKWDKDPAANLRRITRPPRAGKRKA